MRGVGMPESFREELGLTAITAITSDSKELPSAPAFPTDAMPRPCRALINEASAAIGCPPEFMGVPMLVALGCAIGNSRVLKLKNGWEESAAIYAAVVADPGEKKTPALKVALEPVQRLQAKLREEHRREVDEHKRELRRYEVDKKDAAKAGEPAPPPPEEPVMDRTIVEDVTVERLADLLGENPRGLMQTRDELTGWVKGMDQYKQGGKGADRQFWLSAWSNSYVSVDRKNRNEPLMVGRPFAGVFGGIQPATLPELGANREDGLLDRFAFSYPEPLLSEWTDDEISDEARDGYAQLYQKLRGLYMPCDEYGDPDPVRMHFSPDAKGVVKEAMNGHRREMYAPGFPARLKGPWSKLEAYLARLCLILAMARAAEDGDAERVEAKDVLAAVVLIDYFKAMARRVYVGLHGEDPDDNLTADIAEFLRKRGGSWEGQPAELHQQLESRYKPPRPDELSKKLKALAARTPGITYESKERWVKELGNKRRFVTLSLRIGGNGGNGGNGGAA